MTDPDQPYRRLGDTLMAGIERDICRRVDVIWLVVELAAIGAALVLAWRWLRWAFR